MVNLKFINRIGPLCSAFNPLHPDIPCFCFCKISKYPAGPMIIYRLDIPVCDIVIGHLYFILFAVCRFPQDVNRVDFCLSTKVNPDPERILFRSAPTGRFVAVYYVSGSIGGILIAGLHRLAARKVFPGNPTWILIGINL